MATLDIGTVQALIRVKSELGPAIKEISELSVSIGSVEKAIPKWTERQQRATMGMAGLHEQALQMNQTLGASSAGYGNLADSVGRVSTSLARSVGVLGLPAEALRALDDASDVAELGLKGVAGGLRGAVTASTAFSAATIGAVGAAAALGAGLGTLLRWIGETSFGMNVLGLNTKKLDDDIARLVGVVKASKDQMFTAEGAAKFAAGVEQQVETLRGLGRTIDDIAKTTGLKQLLEPLTEGDKIAKLKELGFSTREITKLIPALTDNLKGESEAQKLAADAAKQHEEAIRKLSDAMTGADLAKQAGEMAEALSGPGVLDAMTSNLPLLEKQHEAIRALVKGGLKDLPIALQVVEDRWWALSSAMTEANRVTGGGSGFGSSFFGEMADAATKFDEVNTGLDTLQNNMVEFGNASLEALIPFAKMLGISEEALRAMAGSPVFDEMKSDTVAAAEAQQQLASKLFLVSDLLNMIAANAGGATAEIANLGSAAIDVAGAFKAASAEGAGFDANMNLIGAAFKVGWELGDLFSSDDEEKYMANVERAALEASAALGLYVSNAIAAKVFSDQMQFGIDAASAALLHISDVAEESGTSVTELTTQVAALYAAVATGAVPAKEGLEELGELFSMLAEEAEAGSVSAMAMMGQMAAAARAIGKDVPEITAAVKAAVQESVGALGGLGGIKIVNEADAKAQAQIFLSVFNGVLATEGIVAAAQAIQPSLKAFREQLASAGIGKGAVDAILGPINSAMSLLKNDMTKGGAEGAQALKTILESQLKVGFLDTGTFGAIQQQAKTAFDQMIEGGADTGAAFQAIAPLLAQIQQTAAAAGQALDPVSQQLIDQAKAAGVAFPVDTGTQMVDLLKELVTVMGGALPASVTQAASSMSQIGGATAAAASSATDSLAQIQLAAGVTSDTLGAQFTAAFDQAQQGAQAFLGSLQLIDGTRISIPFDFSGGGTEIPAFQAGGWLKANPPHGTIFRAGEKEDEAIFTKSGLAKLMAGAGGQRASRGGFQSNLTIYASNWGQRRLADELKRIQRRQIRGAGGG